MVKVVNSNKLQTIGAGTAVVTTLSPVMQNGRPPLWIECDGIKANQEIKTTAGNATLPTLPGQTVRIPEILSSVVISML